MVPGAPADFTRLLKNQGDFNCLLLVGHGRSNKAPSSSLLKSYWDVLRSQPSSGLILLAVWTCGSPDPELKDEVLHANDLFQIGLASGVNLNAKEGFTFFARFFEELVLHSPDRITAPMARFAFTKTRHFARGKIEIRY